MFSRRRTKFLQHEITRPSQMPTTAPLAPPDAQERGRAACQEAPEAAHPSTQPLNLSQLIRSHGMTLIYAARKLSLTYSALSQPRTMWRQSEHRKLFQLEAILGITHADMIGALEESARQA